MTETERELSPQEREAVEGFVFAMQTMAAAIEGLDEVGLDAVTALRSIPGEAEGSTAFDSLPPAIRLLLG